jgi:metal-sulfur cluster biosynthetic enzyme
MATKKPKLDTQIKQVLKQSPMVEEVEVKLKYEMPEKDSGPEDVNKHKWKGTME